MTIFDYYLMKKADVSDEYVKNTNSFLEFAHIRFLNLFLFILYTKNPSP